MHKVRNVTRLKSISNPDPDHPSRRATPPAAVKVRILEVRDEAQRAMMGARTLLGRIAEVRKIADLALFLCSPEADYLTSRTLTVNGGWLIT